MFPTIRIPSRPPYTQGPRAVRSLRGFTLLELLVVISIMAMLATLTLSAVKTVRGAAQSANCQSNLRQVGLAAITYADDWDGNVVLSRNTAAPVASEYSGRRLPEILAVCRVG